MKLRPIPGFKIIKSFFLRHQRRGTINSGVCPGNTKGGSITVPLTSCLTGLDQSVLQIKMKIVSCHTDDSKPVKQEVNSTMILPPLVFPGVSQAQRQDQSMHTLLFWFIFSSFEHAKNLLIMGPNNTKNCSLKCEFLIFNYE